MLDEMNNLCSIFTSQFYQSQPELFITYHHFRCNILELTINHMIVLNKFTIRKFLPQIIHFYSKKDTNYLHLKYLLELLTIVNTFIIFAHS